MAPFECDVTSSYHITQQVQRQYFKKDGKGNQHGPPLGHLWIFGRGGMGLMRDWLEEWFGEGRRKAFVEPTFG